MSAASSTFHQIMKKCVAYEVNLHFVLSYSCPSARHDIRRIFPVLIRHLIYMKSACDKVIPCLGSVPFFVSCHKISFFFFFHHLTEISRFLPPDINTNYDNKTTCYLNMIFFLVNRLIRCLCLYRLDKLSSRILMRRTKDRAHQSKRSPAGASG